MNVFGIIRVMLNGIFWVGKFALSILGWGRWRWDGIHLNYQRTDVHVAPLTEHPSFSGGRGHFSDRAWSYHRLG